MPASCALCHSACFPLLLYTRAQLPGAERGPWDGGGAEREVGERSGGVPARSSGRLAAGAQLQDLAALQKVGPGRRLVQTASHAGCLGVFGHHQVRQT